MQLGQNLLFSHASVADALEEYELAQNKQADDYTAAGLNEVERARLCRNVSGSSDLSA